MGAQDDPHQVGTRGKHDETFSSGKTSARLGMRRTEATQGGELANANVPTLAGNVRTAVAPRLVALRPVERRRSKDLATPDYTCAGL